VFTTWNYLVYPPAGYLTTARKRFPDPHSEIPREQRHTNPPFETAMEMVRGVSPLVCPDEAEPAKSMVRIEAFWREFEKDALASFPEAFRQHMILSRVYQSRLYVGQLSEHDFQCYKTLYDTSVVKLRSYGYGAATFGENWTADDYVDVTHPSPEGSKKLAAELAPMIRQLAQQLGYLE